MNEQKLEDLIHRIVDERMETNKTVPAEGKERDLRRVTDVELRHNYFLAATLDLFNAMDILNTRAYGSDEWVTASHQYTAALEHLAQLSGREDDVRDVSECTQSPVTNNMIPVYAKANPGEIAPCIGYTYAHLVQQALDAPEPAKPELQGGLRLAARLVNTWAHGRLQWMKALHGTDRKGKPFDLAVEIEYGERLVADLNRVLREE